MDLAPIAREPVAAVLEDDERRARKALGELVNYGLLEKREERWQVSHALVHTYARNELAMSKENLERLAGWYIASCRAQSQAGLEGYAILDAERAHCLRLMKSCLDSELLQEVKVLVEAISIYLDRQGWWTERLAALKMRLTVARKAENHRDEARYLNDLGYTCSRFGEKKQALKWYEQCLPIWRKLEDYKNEGVTLNNMASIYRQQSKYEQALDYFEQSLSIRRKVGDWQGEVRTLNNIGMLYYVQGKYDEALSYYEQCLFIIYNPYPNPWGGQVAKYKTLSIDARNLEGSLLNNIATIYAAQGKLGKALEYYQKDLATIQREFGDRAMEAVTSWNIGLTYKDMGDIAQAVEHLSLAVEIKEAIGTPDAQECRDYLEQIQIRVAWKETQET
ncbi:MAG: tetratricopeptide repeat protein [Candidatus Electrothrix sp. AS4_5]|nr:tetratricopeptide repeat protein [Candidatus Electrothrix gigas]